MTRPRARSSRVVGVARGEPREARPPSDQDGAARTARAPVGPPWLQHLGEVPLAVLARLAPCNACGEGPAGPPGVCAGCATDIRLAVAAQRLRSPDTVWLGPYAGVWSRLVHALKYRGARRLAPFLGELLAESVQAAGWRPQLVVHVPTTASRARDRGYDQAELLAVSAALELGAPHAAPLERVVTTTKLAGLGRSARRAVLGGAFRARRLHASTVLLVDDVLTTGATLAAAGAALEAAGAAVVLRAVVARTAPAEAPAETPSPSLRAP